MANVAQKHEFQDKDGEYYYWTLGNIEKPWLLLIPGLTSTHSDLLPLAYSFEEEYYVIIPDLPGWGESSLLPSQQFIHDYAVFLHSLVTSLGEKKVTIVGYCFGSVIGLDYALSYPSGVIKNIFISTPYLKGAPLNEFPFYCAELSTHMPKAFRPILFLWRSRITLAPIILFHYHTKSLRKKLHMLRRAFKVQPKQNEQAVEENWVSLAKFSFDNLQRISQPVHLIHGDGDLMVPLSQAMKFQSLFKNATLDIIKGSGHWIPAEKPKSLGHMVSQYLSV